MANGEQNGAGFSPLWYAVGAIVLVLGFMAALISFKPLDFKPVPAVHCEGESCGSTPPEPEGVSHEHEAPPHAE